MTDRSSQPTSSEDNSHLTAQKGSTRRFTVTLKKNTANINNIISTNEEISSQVSSSDSLNSELNDKLLSASVSKKISNKATQTTDKKPTTVKTTNSKNTQNKILPTAPTITISTKQENSFPIFPEIPKHINYPDSHKPAVIHALFDPKRIKIDPARPLTDIPEPAPRQVLADETTHEMFYRFQQELSETNGHADDKFGKSLDNKSDKQEKLTESRIYITEADKRQHRQAQLKAITVNQKSSKWELIQSPALADHLALLSAGRLVKLPKNFYHNTSIRPLLTSISDMLLVDMSQIQSSIEQLSTKYKDKGILTRQGFISKRKLTAKNKLSKIKHQLKKEKCLPTADNIHNLELASGWEAILHPERFDSDEMGYSNLTTDIMATSVCLHALKQCPTRKSINDKLTATDIAKYLRSYLLSQCNELPHRQEHLKHIHIYAGHVIVVAKILGWQMEYVIEDNNKSGKQKGEMIFNVSSRCGLFSRYPILSDYYTNGWHV